MFLIDQKILADKPLTLRSIRKYDNVLLQFTAARFITNYDTVYYPGLLQYYDSLVITILDNFYYNLRQVLQSTTLLQFTTENT